MRPLRMFTIEPSLPEQLAPLTELAHNLWWCWQGDVLELFRRLDSQGWEDCYHNPVALLGRIPQERLNELAKDDGFIAHLQRAHRQPEGISLRRRLVAQDLRRRPNAQGGLLLRGVRPQRVPADLLRRPGRARRRPPQERHRARPAPGGRGPALPAGLLPPAPQRRRLAARAVPPQRLPQHAHRAVPQRGRLAAGRSRSRCPNRMVRAQVWVVHVGRIPLYLLDTNVPGELARGPAHHRPALRRRPGDAHPPGDPPRHRRRRGCSRPWASTPRPST